MKEAIFMGEILSMLTVKIILYFDWWFEDEMSSRFRSAKTESKTKKYESGCPFLVEIKGKQKSYRYPVSI